MALQTKRELVQELLYEAYGGIQSDDIRISERMVLRLLNNEIASVATMSAIGMANTEGYFCIDDTFNITYANQTLLTDATYGLQYFLLPAAPNGLPRQRSFQVFPTIGNKILFKPVSRADYTKLQGLPSIKKVYYFIENGKVFFDFSGVKKYNPLVNFSQLNITISTPGALDLDEQLNMPADVIKGMKLILVPRIRQMAQIPQDSIIDGVDITPVR